jgi:SAM-dependent methyltransferase
MNLYIPKPDEQFTEELSWGWYCNIPIELTDDFLSSAQKTYLAEYYIEAGLLRSWRRPFFRYHYARTFALAVSFLFANPDKKPVILDLGCGTGTQSLAFALLGAKVFSLDMDDRALEILIKRKALYEQHSGRFLDINVYNADVFKFDYKEIEAIDGLFSMFAFNMMQPTKKLLPLMISGLSNEGRIAILDGNNLCWLSKFPWRRRNVLSPIELNDELTENEFDVVLHNGGITFPPVAWYLLPYSLLKNLDNWVGCKSWMFPISHLIMAKHR